MSKPALQKPLMAWKALRPARRAIESGSPVGDVGCQSEKRSMAAMSSMESVTMTMNPKGDFHCRVVCEHVAEVDVFAVAESSAKEEREC